MRAYSVSEYASLFKISRKTVYKLIRSGQLNARRFGRVLRILDAEVPELVRAEQQEGSGERADD